MHDRNKLPCGKFNIKGVEAQAGEIALLEHVEQGIRRGMKLYASSLLGIPDRGSHVPAQREKVSRGFNI